MLLKIWLEKYQIWVVVALEVLPISFLGDFLISNSCKHHLIFTAWIDELKLPCKGLMGNKSGRCKLFLLCSNFLQGFVLECLHTCEQLYRFSAAKQMAYFSLWFWCKMSQLILDHKFHACLVVTKHSDACCLFYFLNANSAPRLVAHLSSK